MRLIDADRFKNWIMDRYICFDHTLDDIDAQPTIVPERKKGRWITKSTNGEMFDVCSACGYVEWDTPRNFCPNCGADMRGEEDVGN